MSQVSRSQSQIFYLRDLIDSLNKKKVEPVSFDLNEDDLETWSLGQKFSEPGDDSNTIELIGKFCSNYLTKYSFEHLNEEKFFQTISHHLYSDTNSLFLHSPSDFEAELATLLASVDSIYDYLSKTSSVAQIKFESIDLFILSSFYLFVQLCNHFKNQKQSSQRICLSQQNTRPEARLSAQLIKASSLFESKIINLNEDTNKQNLIKLTKFLIYLIKNFKDAKSNVFVWKMISRLCVKFKILLNNHDYSDIFYQNNGKFLLKKIFILIYEDQNVNLNYIKDSLKRLSLNETDKVSDMSSAIGSQMTLKNNIYLDTAKVIKLSAFLAKILKSFLSIYLDNLVKFLHNEFFDMLAGLLSSISSILLTESRINNQCLTIDTNQFDFQPNQFINLPKDYVSIKLDFMKEFSPIYESLFQMIETNSDFANYISQKNFFMDKLKQNNDEPDESIFPNSQIGPAPNEQQDNDDILLFYVIFINRSKIRPYCMDESNQNFEMSKNPAYLNQIFNLVELSSISVCMPTFFLYNDHFLQNLDFNYLSKVNYESNIFYKIEFYDFILICLTRYILSLIAINTDVEQVLYFLVNNLLIVNKLIDENSQNQSNVYQFYPLRIQMSSEILICLAKWLIKSNSTENLVKFIKFLAEIFENNGPGSTFMQNFHLKFVLSEILETCSRHPKFSNILSLLKEFYINRHLFNCFNLIVPYLTKSEYSKKEAFIANTLIRANELFDDLTKLFLDKSKIPNEQIWMKKVVVFFDANHFAEVLAIIDDFLNKDRSEMLPIVNEQAEKLLKKISQFLKLDQIVNLNKYFEHFNQYKTEMSRKMNTNQLIGKQFSLNMENFKKIFQCICVCTRIYASLSLKSKTVINEDILFLLDFFIKNCSQEYEAKITNLGTHEPAFLNIKLEAGQFLCNLSKKEINETNLMNKILDLFGILLNDSSNLIKFFTLECLDEYSKANESNNKIICQLSRSNKNLNDLILNYLVEISIDDNFDQMSYHLERRDQLIKKLKVHHQPKDDGLMSQKSNEVEECAGLDETMNAIMCAMDTTISNQESKFYDLNDESNKTNLDSKAQGILDGISDELNKLVNMYESEPMSESVRIKLTSLVTKMSSFI